MVQRFLKFIQKSIHTIIFNIFEVFCFSWREEEGWRKKRNEENIRTLWENWEILLKMKCFAYFYMKKKKEFEKISTISLKTMKIIFFSRLN